ncbi:MAG: OmpA family protein [bacterium]
MNLKLRERTTLNVWPAFADMAICIVLILIFFLSFQFLRTASKILVENDQAKMEENFKERFKGKMEKKIIKIRVDGNLQRFVFSDEILFEPGSAVFKPEGIEILRKVGEIFKSSRNLYENIHIEGHTDNIPIGRSIMWKFPTNWELSSARATSVVRFFEDEVRINPALLSATGFSEYQPIAKNEFDNKGEPSGNPLNRRIEIVLVYSEKKFLGQD